MNSTGILRQSDKKKKKGFAPNCHTPLPLVETSAKMAWVLNLQKMLREVCEVWG